MRNLFRFPLLTALFMSLLSTVTLADFHLGISYYTEKDYANAYREFFEAAQYGDYDAQNNIGIMHLRGEHVANDKVTAYAWMKLATQAKVYEESGTAQKVYALLSDTDKNRATAEYQTLFALYSDKAIDEKLTPTYSGTNLFTKSQRPTKRTQPKYPVSMIRAGKSGFVDVIFTVDKYGITRDHVVTYASGDAFKKAALEALRKNQYEPMTIDNKAVDVNGNKMRFSFTMEGAEVDKKRLARMINQRREKAKTGTNKDKLSFAYFLESVDSIVKDYPLTDNPNEWYVLAATEGNSAASYFLGRNILYGNMCQQDNHQSMGWLLKAAKAGISDAQYMLAIESFNGARFEKNEDKGFYWLSQAARVNPSAKLRYAWILSTHTDIKRRNGKLASEQLKAITKDYSDQQTYLQTQAAVAAENGDFKQAIKWQQQAIKDAQELELPDQHLQQQLASYSAQKPWREDI